MMNQHLGAIFSEINNPSQNYATTILESIAALETTKNIFLNPNNAYMNQTLITNEFRQILNNVYSSENPISAMNLINNINKYAMNHNQDLNQCNNPYTFLYYFLLMLDEEYYNAFQIQNNLNQEFPDIENAANFFKQIYESPSISIISKNYNFSLIMTNFCNGCNSKKFKPIFKKTIDLTIDSYYQMNNSQPLTINDCLKYYFTPKQVSLNCQNCNSSNAFQARIILKSGPVIIINLMRNNYTGEKDPNFVIDFNIDISPYKKNKNDGNNIYTLKSCISYSSYGFFTDCLAKMDNNKGTWFRYMDKQVVLNNESLLFGFQPVLLFYEANDNQNNNINNNMNVNQNLNMNQNNNISIQNNQNKSFDIISNFPLIKEIYFRDIIHNFEFDFNNNLNSINNEQSNLQMNNNFNNFNNYQNQNNNNFGNISSQPQNQYNMNQNNNNLNDMNNMNNNIMINQNINNNNNLNQNVNRIGNYDENENKIEENDNQNSNNNNNNEMVNNPFFNEMKNSEQNQNSNFANNNFNMNINMQNNINQNINQNENINNDINPNLNKNDNSNFGNNINLYQNDNNIAQNINNNNQGDFSGQNQNDQLNQFNNNFNNEMQNNMQKNININNNINNVQNQKIQNISQQNNFMPNNNNIISNDMSSNMNSQENKKIEVPQMPSINIPQEEIKNNFNQDINPSLQSNQNLNNENQNKINNEIPQNMMNPINMNINPNQNNFNAKIPQVNIPQNIPNKIHEIKKEEPKQIKKEIPKKEEAKPKPIKKEMPKPQNKNEPIKKEQKIENKKPPENQAARKNSVAEKAKLFAAGGIKFNPPQQAAAPVKRLSHDIFPKNEPKKEESKPMHFGGGQLNKMKDFKAMFEKRGGIMGAQRPSAQMMGMPHGFGGMMLNNNDNSGQGPTVDENKDLDKKLDKIPVQKKKKKAKINFDDEN